ncbi:MAG: hypothetical protein H6733_08805 [Alphaproteobacteria bacterium]|nr:hypothetical protein [Alphaproteobacteria bacterium]
MARLGGSIDQVFKARTDVATTLAHFADPKAIEAATDRAERIEDLGGLKLRFHLQPQNHGVYTVTPVYTVQYRIDGATLSWSTLDGNMGSEGTARFTARADGGTDVHYVHRIEIEMPVGGMVAKMLQPVVSRMVTPNLQAYVQHLLDTLP